MRVIAVLLAALLPATPADTTGLCERADTISIVECLKGEQAREEARLRAVEREAREDLTPRARTSFDAVRQRWVAYRLAECRAYADSFAGATIGGPSAAQCMIDLTAARRRLLSRLYLSAP